MKLIILLSVFVMLLSGFAATAPCNEIMSSVLGCGGEEIGGSFCVLHSTIGQSCAGKLLAPSSIQYAGYWGPPLVRVIPAYLASFTVERAGDHIILRWRTACVVEGAGFRIWRQSPNGDRIQIGRDPGGSGACHEFVDIDPPPVDLQYWLEAIGEDGVTSWYGPAVAPALPLSFILRPNVPNPFNPITRLYWSTPDAGHVRLAIYDVQGRLIRMLVDEIVPAGQYDAVWSGADDRGAPTASGIYMARLESKHGVCVQKLVLAR